MNALFAMQIWTDDPTLYHIPQIRFCLFRYWLRHGEESDLQFTLLSPPDVVLTEELADTLRTSEAGTLHPASSGVITHTSSVTSSSCGGRGSKPMLSISICVRLGPSTSSSCCRVCGFSRMG
jgi:hypothetical protein